MEPLGDLYLGNVFLDIPLTRRSRVHRYPHVGKDKVGLYL